ncbi:MAG: alpha/beta fold hydrolase [Candidatus Nanoarchaeia archaeon]|nr:alpha/beta fold hydrolase [Candidatus Nanoarchaeia archaeon]
MLSFKKLRWVFFSLILLLLIFSLMLVSVKISFMLGYDLSIALEPGDISLELTNNQPKDINFTVKTSNKLECNTQCEYSFKDLSNNNTIESDTVMLKPKQQLTRTYSLVAPEKGSGQRLYNFEVRCKNFKSLFCQTSGKVVLKNSLITLNYDLTNEEKIFKPESKIKLESLMKQLNELDLVFKEVKQKSDIIYSEEISAAKLDLDKNFEEFNLHVENLKALWNKEYYTELYSELNETDKQTVEMLLNDSFSLNDSLTSIIEINDYSVDFFEKVLQNNLSLVYYINASNDYKFIEKFNDTLDIFNNNLFGNYSVLLDDVNTLKEEYNSLNLTEAGESIPFLIDLVELKKTKFFFNETIVSDIKTKLSENPPLCCVFGECNPCCNDLSCKEDKSLFPIIFVHGHAVNKQSSPEQELNSFNEIQYKFSEEGYINAGIVTPYSTYDEFKEGEWGLSGRPITARVTYYYDLVKDGDSYVLVQKKGDDISVYATRLKHIIDLVKYRTGKSKVNIVAHSMGGLVSREYLKLYGESDVNKLILIGTPNNGITSKIYSLCKILGETKECDQMDQGSTFLDDLNQFQPNMTRLYTISGRGCDMSGQDGDGIVLFKSSVIQNTKNFEVIGECSGLGFLHSSMLDLNMHPETYTHLKDILYD